jgi:predicted transcriptional regulator
MIALDLVVLRAIVHANEAPTQGALAEATGATTSAIAHSLSRLQAAGIVELAKDPNDGRRMIPKLAIVSALARLEETCRVVLGFALAPAE